MGREVERHDIWTWRFENNAPKETKPVHQLNGTPNLVTYHIPFASLNQLHTLKKRKGIVTLIKSTCNKSNYNDMPEDDLINKNHINFNTTSSALLHHMICLSCLNLVCFACLARYARYDPMSPSETIVQH
ncbi:hypothetical protein YC2023_104163 [Brassica napus]